jgi:radical SAM superfamily enzyme YgiQ (UPF0313 family)
LCSAIEQSGYDLVCEILDQEASPFSLSQLIDKASREDVLFLGFYSHSLIKDILIGCLKKIKAACNVPVIIGGPGYIHDRDFLDNGCDIVVHGEGENTILDVINYLEGGRQLNSVKGVSYKEGGSLLYNGSRDLIENLDDIPFPSRDKIALDKYYDHYNLSARLPYATMITSRGCVFECLFCNSPDIWLRRYRVRSVGNVIREIDSLVSDYKVKYISFQDDIFSWNQEWLNDFCGVLIKKRYDLNWMCLLHPFSLRENREKSIRLMKRAGCRLISFGLQSVDGHVLRNINRSPKEPQALAEMVALTKKNGILTNIDFIFGLPGDTRETLEKNIEYALRVRPHLANFHPVMVVPGTLLESLYSDSGKRNFTQEELFSLSSRASRRFFSKPKTLSRIFWHVLKNNPGWLLLLPFFLRYIVDMLGLTGIRRAARSGEKRGFKVREESGEWKDLF